MLYCGEFNLWLEKRSLIVPGQADDRHACYSVSLANGLCGQELEIGGKTMELKTGVPATRFAQASIAFWRPAVLPNDLTAEAKRQLLAGFMLCGPLHQVLTQLQASMFRRPTTKEKPEEVWTRWQQWTMDNWGLEAVQP